MNTKKIDTEFAAHPFIDARKNSTHRIFIKAISLVVIFSFIYQQAAFGMYNTFSPAPAASQQPLKVTNYDRISYNDKDSAIKKLLHDDLAKAKAVAFSKVIAQWDGPKLAADKLFEHYGSTRPLTHSGSAGPARNQMGD